MIKQVKGRWRKDQGGTSQELSVRFSLHCRSWYLHTCSELDVTDSDSLEGDPGYAAENKSCSSRDNNINK